MCEESSTSNIIALQKEGSGVVSAFAAETEKLNYPCRSARSEIPFRFDRAHRERA